MGGIFSLEARDMDTKLLSAPESNNTLARCSSLGIVVGGILALICIMSFLPTVLSQMAHLVANITLNNARSYLMQSVFLTQGIVSSIPIIFSWSDNIRPEGFLSFVQLWLVIIVAVVGVGVGVTVVVVIIVAVVVVVESWAYAFHQDKASSVRVPVANVTLFSSAHLLRENTDLVRSNQRMRPTAPSVPFKLEKMTSYEFLNVPIFAIGVSSRPGFYSWDYLAPAQVEGLCFQEPQMTLSATSFFNGSLSHGRCFRC
ncbi:hypothetical protein Tco_0785278 [Tanacetum coccineum]